MKGSITWSVEEDVAVVSRNVATTISWESRTVWSGKQIEKRTWYPVVSPCWCTGLVACCVRYRSLRTIILNPDICSIFLDNKKLFFWLFHSILLLFRIQALSFTSISLFLLPELLCSLSQLHYVAQHTQIHQPECKLMSSLHCGLCKVKAHHCHHAVHYAVYCIGSVHFMSWWIVNQHRLTCS